ncbi:MAG: hypothetical protein IRZ23_07175 [Acetobacteraceae bacterium]|nr:hypothetical protein [Acetobacteraceae bacterium]
MTREQFLASLSEASPPKVSAPLQGLWWDAKGDWKQAHASVQNADGAEAAWVHAYLHRKEGDLSNARYWYRKAGKPVPNTALGEEWDALLAALLG